MDLNGRITVFGALIASLALGGCVSSPTYGTDKTAGGQLLDDVSNLASFGPKKRNQIAYNPRPELVRPAEGKAAQLPAPQAAVDTAGNPNWPESPEARRKRIRDTATANQNNPNFTPEVENDMPLAKADADKSDYGFFGDKVPKVVPHGQTDQSAEFRARKLASTAGSPTTRRYLSEPPLEYRAPAATAAADDLGEDEAKKERERKAAARKDKGFSWRNLIPWE
ncbi:MULTISPECIES: hypothetical protein [Phyllobacterium]|jgi:hypothetical protein|uniref:Lipoprotein n=1 Tax=Phyllobacterium sophorae TaxID=1520277 RepID=A0A2P7BBU5_9HYPH|nr:MULTISPECIES: hypothetical protein [Phyllobacterium]PSH63950.1 hypothetical protein CU103_12905 [Phyllobacterium sophorae]UXN63229.1 hypothetical protein N8E89_11285 [Phyllobacterium sp. A18/5-2]